MHIVKLTLFSSAAMLGVMLSARGAVLIQVNQSTQHMSVDVDGHHLYDWRVSTGRPGYDTPDGNFIPNRMDADHHSDEYDQAPMPHAIFFDLHGHAIHGTFDPVGQPAASHGCVRLDPANAAKLFNLVRAEGMASTKIEIGGDVTVALRKAKSAPKQVAAIRRTRTPKASDEDETFPQVYSAEPEQDQRYNFQSDGYSDLPSQPAWPW